MADALYYEFQAEGLDAKALYDKVNEELGVDFSVGNEDSSPPTGMLMHIAATVTPNRMMITEVWDSKASQEKFMAEHLGPALGKVGVPDPIRLEWMTVIGSEPSL